MASGIQTTIIKIQFKKMATLNFGGVDETVVTREEFPLSKAQQVLKDEVVAVIGYGVQGPGQALNQKDNGVNVIVGQRKNSKTWDKAVRDGFVPGETLLKLKRPSKKEPLYVIYSVMRRRLNCGPL